MQQLFFLQTKNQNIIVIRLFVNIIMTSRRQSSSILHFKDENLLQNILTSYRQQKSRKNSLANHGSCEQNNRNVLGTIQNYTNIKSSILQKDQKTPQIKSNWMSKTGGLLSQNKQQKCISKELFSNKIMMNKKLEKLQKQAISQYSSGNIQQAFKLLQKGHKTIKKQQIQSKQHSIYLSYLKIHFSFKSFSKLDSCQQQFQIANTLISHCSKQQKSKLSEYIFTIKCYQIQHLCSKIQYSKSLGLIKQLQAFKWQSKNQRKQKMLRKITKLKVVCLQNLRRFTETIQVIDKILQNSSTAGYTLGDIQFFVLTKYSCLICKQDIQIGNQFLLKYVALQQKINQDEFKLFYSYKIWETYYNNAKKSDDKLFLIYYLTEWRNKQSQCDKLIKINEELFDIHFQIGDYEEADLQFKRYIESNLKNPDFKIYRNAIQIKLFLGQKEEALQLLGEMIELFQPQPKKLQILIKILQIQQGQNQQILLKQIQKLFKKTKLILQGSQFKQLLNNYEQILISMGKRQRIKKVRQKLKLQI